jgi:hypothetical protein
MNESRVLKSSLPLAGIHPVKRRVAAAAAVAASAWPLPAPRCNAGGKAAANGVASWAGLYPGKNLAAAPPRAAAASRCRRYRHCTPTCCRAAAAVLLSCLHWCCCARTAARRACGALEGSSTTQLSFFWSFGKLLLPPKQ